MRAFLLLSDGTINQKAGFYYLVLNSKVGRACCLFETTLVQFCSLYVLFS